MDQAHLNYTNILRHPYDGHKCYVFYLKNPPIACLFRVKSKVSRLTLKALMIRHPYPSGLTLCYSVPWSHPSSHTSLSAVPWSRSAHSCLGPFVHVFFCLGLQFDICMVWSISSLGSLVIYHFGSEAFSVEIKSPQSTLSTPPALFYFSLFFYIFIFLCITWNRLTSFPSVSILSSMRTGFKLYLQLTPNARSCAWYLAGV